MHLADEVLPAVPIRQWVLSLPYRIRFLLAHDGKLCGTVRRILVRTLLGWLKERGESAGIRLVAPVQSSWERRFLHDPPRTERQPLLVRDRRCHAVGLPSAPRATDAHASRQTLHAA